MATTKPDLDIVQELVTEFGENASYVAELLGRYRMNPASVDEEWRAFFRDRLGETEPAAPPVARPAERPNPPPAAPSVREPEAPAAPRSPAPPGPRPLTLSAAGRETTAAADVTPEPLRGAALRIAEN